MDLSGQILDTAIGLTFIFVALSLVCSFIQELIATVFSWRSEFLERGLRSMLQRTPESDDDGPDTAGEGLTDKVLTSAFIREKLSAQARKRGRRVPSYLSSRTFGLALLDTIAPPAAGGGDVLKRAREGLAKFLPDAEHPVRRQLEVLIDEAGEDRDSFRRAIEGWYDDTMDVLGGDDSTIAWLAGVLLTGFALSFGAPFWFDALSKLARLRISGRRPQPS